MKLRFPLRLQQTLFAVIGTACLQTGVWAQAPAPAAAAPDVVIMTTNEAKQVKVLGVSPTGTTLNIQVGAGQLGLPLATVKEVRMAQPLEMTMALTAYQQKDFAKALTLIKAVTDKYRGMPSPWALQATSMLGELYIATNDLAKAETAYNDFKKFYPAGGSLQSDVGLSRLALAKKDYDGAKQKLGPITDAALQEKIINPSNALAYSQAFLVSGQVKEAEGNLPGALEDYLRTVTLFYHDRAAVATAQERANALREAHKDVTAP
jgi:hypothetical protein